jgi:hypothetical protein
MGMKRFALALLVCLSGCATAPKYSCEESCALQGMVCTGQSITSGGGSTYAPDWTGKTGGSTALHAGSSDTFHCAKDPSRAAEIKAVLSKMAKREEIAGPLSDFECQPGRMAENLALRKRCEAMSKSASVAP